MYTEANTTVFILSVVLVGMPDEDFLLQGGKVLAGAGIFIMFFTLLSMMIPASYPFMEEEPEVEIPSVPERIRDFLLSFPYNFCIGGIFIIVSVVGSYYSKVPAVAGDVLRSLSPFQGYIFGFGAMLIFGGFF